MAEPITLVVPAELAAALAAALAPHLPRPDEWLPLDEALHLTRAHAAALGRSGRLPEARKKLRRWWAPRSAIDRFIADGAPSALITSSRGSTSAPLDRAAALAAVEASMAARKNRPGKAFPAGQHVTTTERSSACPSPPKVAGRRGVSP